MTTVVYRGVLQRSRLRLLLTALGGEKEPNRFIWVSTKPTDEEQVRRLTDVLGSLPVAYDWEITDGSLPSFFAARRRTTRGVGDAPGRIGVIGASALPYLPVSRRPVILCINGIPEERLLQRPGRLSRMRTAAAWALYGAAMRPRRGSGAITVSTRMSALVRERLRIAQTVEAPTAAGEEYFQVPLTPPGERDYDFCYQGSGAVWQNLPHLNRVWRAIVALRPESRFLVLSYDKRCRVLAEGLPGDNVEFIEAFQPGDVARHLARCRIGFVLRSPDIVNQVSFPTKIGESLACGVSLVLTDLGWDPGDFLAGTPVARIVDADSPPEATAGAALELLDGLTGDLPEQCREVAQGLRRDRLVKAVRSVLQEVHGHAQA